MIPPTDLLDMLAERAHNPHRAVVEAVLLHVALDRLDDYARTLELHLLTDHDDDPGAIPVIECLQLMQHRIATELAGVADTLTTEIVIARPGEPT